MEQKFYKPNIIISQCINFEACRFNGGIIKDDFLARLGQYVNYVPVCPEVAIGLGTPRMPVRLYRDEAGLHLHQPGTDLDVTKKMLDFSKKFLQTQENIDGFILKNRSPSCGVKDVKVYNKKDSHVSTERNGNGIFANEVLDAFVWYPVEDEWRLKNFRLREEFLTSIFCLSRFRSVKKEWKISDLVQFQADNKYLFMTYSSVLQKKLGNIVASYDKNFLEIICKYEEILLELLSKRPKIWATINAMEHVFGYFKDTCSSEEKKFFLETLSVYKEWRIPASSVIHMLKTWALHAKQEYILSQSLLQPFPTDLIELSDSWKKLHL